MSIFKKEYLSILIFFVNLKMLVIKYSIEYILCLHTYLVMYYSHSISIVLTLKDKMEVCVKF